MRHASPRGRRSWRRRPAAGTSLLESLVATALMAFIVIAIFPLFHQALRQNVSGSDSNQATNHGRSKLEGLLARPYDSRLFSMSDKLPEHTIESESVGDRMTIEDLVWDPADYSPTDVSSAARDRTRYIADGKWISATDGARSRVIWRRRTVIRQYSYADIGEGVIDVNDPTRIVTLGHPQLFDAPLTRDAPDSQVNFREEDVTLTARRPGTRAFRSRLWRTY